MFSTELQYVLVRYVLNELSGDARTVGLLAFHPSSGAIEWRSAPLESVARTIDKRIDSKLLGEFFRMARAASESYSTEGRLSPERIDGMLEALRERGGGLVQLSDPRTALSNDFHGEIESLYWRMIQVGHAAMNDATLPMRARDPFGGIRREANSAILRAVRAGLGSPMRRKMFSRHYQVTGTRRVNSFDLAIFPTSKTSARESLFHHVLALPDAEESFNQAAALCYKWQDVRERHDVTRTLTAVVYSRGVEQSEGMVEATRALQEENIGITNISALPNLVRDMQQQRSFL